jgi:hypothetical protein
VNIEVTILIIFDFWHGAWGMGHGAWSMGHGAWGMGHGAWGMEHVVVAEMSKKKKVNILEIEYKKFSRQIIKHNSFQL